MGFGGDFARWDGCDWMRDWMRDRARSDTNLVAFLFVCVKQVDRFIPSRSALDLDVAHYNLSKEVAGNDGESEVKEIKSPAKVRALEGEGEETFCVYDASTREILTVDCCFLNMHVGGV